MALSKTEKIRQLLARNVEDVIERTHLEAALRSGRKLRVKLGIDPTSPDLHLGHAVVLRKLKEFQDLGHKIVLIIGDFTGRIGDPSGRSEARKPLTEKEIARNMKEYLTQANQIVNVKKAEIRHNSEWFSEDGVRKLFALAGAGSMQQVLRRADFRKRLQAGKDVTFLEMLYPLLQGYDSVQIKADVELGGTDQKFNLLMGRRVQRHFRMKEQDILTVPLLEGLDGVRKMSKSLGNYIGLTEDPDSSFAKVMTLPDSLMQRYFTMCTELEETEIAALAKKLSPRDLKIRLGKEIVALYHGKAAAEKAAEKWVKLFSKKEVFHEAPVLLVDDTKDATWLVVRAIGGSKSAAWRLIQAGGLKLNGKVLTKNPRESLTRKVKQGDIIRIGSHRFFKSTLRKV